MQVLSEMGEMETGDLDVEIVREIFIFIPYNMFGELHVEIVR